MKRFVMLFVSFALIVTGASSVDAGIEDEQVTVIGPVTGASYQTRYSCASGTLHTIFRSDSGKRVVLERTLATNNGAAGTGRSSVAGRNLADFVALALKANAADTWKIEEAFEGAQPFDVIGSPVTVAEGVLDCPDYAAPTPSVFVPITPQRVLDTRPEFAINYSGQRPADRSTVVVERSDLPDLPAGAVAVSTTVTVTEAAGSGYAQLLPTGTQPGGTSNVNPRYPGHTVANNAVSPLSSGGVSIYTHTSAHLLIDVNGYFVAAPSAATAGRYQPLDSSLRILDTRPESAINHTTGIVPARRSLTIPITRWAGLDGEPVAAIVANVTATETGGAGYFQSAATGSLVPGESSILNPTGAGDTVAAMTIVPVSADGNIDIYTHGDSHMVVDVLGWFTSAGAPSSTSGRFVPLEPERVLDTRRDGDPVNCCKEVGSLRGYDFTTGRVLPGNRTTVDVDQIEKAGAGNLMINVTVADATNAGYFQAGAANGFVDGASSTVNAQGPGVIVANAAIVGIGSIGARGFESKSFQIYTQTGGHLVADVSGYFTE